MSRGEKLVEVYEAANEMEAQVIKSLLESYGIPSVFKANAAPSAHMLAITNMGEVKIMVWESAADRARELIVSDEHV